VRRGTPDEIRGWLLSPERRRLREERFQEHRGTFELLGQRATIAVDALTDLLEFGNLVAEFSARVRSAVLSPFSSSVELHFNMIEDTASTALWEMLCAIIPTELKGKDTLDRRDDREEIAARVLPLPSALKNSARWGVWMHDRHSSGHGPEHTHFDARIRRDADSVRVIYPIFPDDPPHWAMLLPEVVEVAP
jgi:hypothetical protein